MTYKRSTTSTTGTAFAGAGAPKSQKTAMPTSYRRVSGVSRKTRCERFRTRIPQGGTPVVAGYGHLSSTISASREAVATSPTVPRS